jgi:hypothetical protein
MEDSVYQYAQELWVTWRESPRRKKAVQQNGFFAFADSAPVTNGVDLTLQVNVRFA